MLSLLGSAGCGEAEKPQPAIATPAPAPGAGEVTAAPEAAAVERSAEELADLEAMCAAVDHDYNDGTLSDYFRGLESKTAWGQALQKRADASTSPGRLLLEAARAAGLKEVDARAPACGRLSEYIDDVE